MPGTLRFVRFGAALTLLGLFASSLSAQTRDGSELRSRPGALTMGSQVSKKKPVSGTGRMVPVVVRMDVPSIASYRGGIAGLSATSPRAIESLTQALAARPSDRAAIASLNRLYRSEAMWSELLENLKLEASMTEKPEDRARLRKEQWMRGSVSVTEAPDALIYAWRQPSDLHREARDPAAEAIGRLETSQVLQAFQELPAPFRTAVSLYFVEEFTYQEIADVLRCSLGTVRSRIHRGRKLLQRALAPLAPAAMGQPAA